MMGETSKIEWTDATWNPWQGCTKVSPACAHCYMFRDMARYGKDPAVVVRSSPPTFNLPLKRKRGGEYAIPDGSKVFTCSWSDWFHESADAWREEAWAIIRQRPDVIFQIVTKRTERIAEHLPKDWGTGYANAWLIATVENQEWADKRIPELLQVPAVARGLSIEPMLGPIVLPRTVAKCPSCGRDPKPIGLRDSMQEPFSYFCSNKKCADNYSLPSIDWVICGGESGTGSRPMHPQWVRSLREQCQQHGWPFFFKQWGEWVPSHPYQRAGDVVMRSDGVICGEVTQTYPNDVNLGISPVAPTFTREGGIHDIDVKHHIEYDERLGSYASMAKVGKKAAGRLLDGVEHNAFPSALSAV